MATKLYPNLAREGENCWPPEEQVNRAVEMFRQCGTVGMASVIARAAERISQEPETYRGSSGDWKRTQAIYEAVRDEHGSFLDSETPPGQLLVKARALELLRLVHEGEHEKAKALADELWPFYANPSEQPSVVAEKQDDRTI